MRKKIVLLLLIAIAAINNAFSQQPATKLANVFSSKNKEILVAAHRGDWRIAPENSIHALLSCIEQGFDMMELDVKMTKDSVLIVMHDQTIDRTTNGKGKVSDYTYEEISKFRLRNGLARVTLNQIPKFHDMMLVAKSKILINVDKGNDHLKEVFNVLNETGTTNQSIVNIGDNIAYQSLIQIEKIPANAYIMVVVDMTKPGAMDLIKTYQPFKNSMIQPIFNTDTLSNINLLPQIATSQRIWLNSLWPSLNGGHDDDRAVEQNQKAESWGWLIDHKPVIIQSDRPKALISYLKERKLHN
ncbi:MAG: glycerophosphodiester phosphodiesterase family protein [Pedobacter sp.]